MAERYQKAPESELGKGSRAVVNFGDGVVFRCPCDERQAYCSSPPHTITFGEDGALTLAPSVGYKARPSLDRPQNWCHFYIKEGIPEMCGDTQCPGGRVVSP